MSDPTPAPSADAAASRKMVRLYNRGLNKHIVLDPDTGERIVFESKSFASVSEAVAAVLLSQGTPDAREYVDANEMGAGEGDSAGLSAKILELEKANAGLLEGLDTGAKVNADLGLRVAGLESLFNKLKTGELGLDTIDDFEAAVARERQAIADENAAAATATAAARKGGRNGKK